MEPKQIGVLIFLLAAAIIGSGYLIYTLQRLEHENEDEAENGHGDSGHH